MKPLYLMFLFLVGAMKLGAANVELMRTPHGGIQPQVAVDSAGNVHLVYYKGSDRAGDLFYVRRGPKDAEFSAPLKVNSVAESAIAAGTIRGAQVAVGKGNRVHVVWNGSGRVKLGDEEITPLYYARLNDAGTAFEAERNLITYAAGLDGGSSIAADSQGNVYATWHAHSPDGEKGEAGRAVFMARSTDEGKTFSREERALREDTGTCACCGMRAFADRNGAVYILYRVAEEKSKRDEVLLVSPKAGAPFEIVSRHPWRIESCPMSSAFLAEGHGKVFAAWETAGQVYFSAVGGKPISPSGTAKRKHPTLATNSKGEVLFAWSEGTAWAKGGSIAWQVYDREMKPVGEIGRAEGLPVWGLVAGFAKADGSFVLVY